MSRKSPCNRIARNWIFCLFVCFVFWILSYPEKSGQGKFWHLVINWLLKVWIVAMQDRIENFVGKYWIRVLGVNYRCSDIAFMGVSQLFEERKRVRKGYFRLRTSWIPWSSGTRSHFEVRVIVLGKTIYFLFPRTFTPSWVVVRLWKAQIIRKRYAGTSSKDLCKQACFRLFESS